MLPDLIYDNLFISIKFQAVGMVGKKNVYWGRLDIEILDTV